MNRFAKTGAIFAATAVSVGLTPKLLSEAVFTSAEINPKIQACANRLGQTATESTTLPQPCKDLANTTGKEWFDYQNVSTYSDSAESGRTITKSQVTYFLPSQKAFLRDNLITAQDDKNNQGMVRVITGIIGGYGLLATAGVFMLEAKSRKPKPKAAI